MKIKNYLQFNLVEIIASLFIIFSLLPWVNFGTNGRDSQIWPLLFGSLFLLTTFRKRVPILFLYPLALPIMGLFGWFFLSDLSATGISAFIAIRGILSYLGFAVCFVAFMFYLREREFPLKIFMNINIIYILVGIFQAYIDPAVVSGIVASRDQTFSNQSTLVRGVPSLTPEPTYFAIYLYFISFLYLINFEFNPPKKVQILLIVNLLAIIFLSRSTMVLLFLLLTIPFLIHRIKLKNLAVALIFILLSTPIFIYLFPETRVLLLIDLLFEEPRFIGLLLIDESINDRISHVIFPLQGALLNDLLPVGFHKWSETYSYLTEYWNGIFWYGSGGSIMSFFGLIVFEFGIFGLILLGYLFIKFQDGTYSRFLETLLLFILMNTSIPPSFPLLAMIFGFYIYSNYYKVTKTLNIKKMVIKNEL